MHNLPMLILIDESSQGPDMMHSYSLTDGAPVSKTIHYVLLGAFASDLEVSGIPSVIFCKETNSDSPLSILVAPNFEECVSIVPPESKWWIDDLLTDLQQIDLGDSEEVASLHARVSSLNVGPLRTISNGMLQLERETVISTFGEALRVILASQTYTDP